MYDGTLATKFQNVFSSYIPEMIPSEEKLQRKNIDKPIQYGAVSNVAEFLSVCVVQLVAHL